MMPNVSVDLNNTGLSMKEIMVYSDKVEKIHNTINKKLKNKTTDLIGWIDWPEKYSTKKEFEKIKKCAGKIQKDSDVLLVIGIGGSYLGARAVIEALTNSFHTKTDNSFPEIIYVGNNLNGTYINEVIDYIQDKDVSINVISKSGTTTEPAIAFRIFRNLLEDKYGIKGAQKRIFVTTDRKSGALRELAGEEDYVSFGIPKNIGGRFSVLTPVGLLPMAVAGINIDKIMAGACFAQEKYNDANLKYNDCYKYAVARNILYKKDKNIEVLACYNPKLHYFIEWWKQLYGESEGKELKGIFPTGAEYTTDLHSLGQYIQEGRRCLFETVLAIKNEECGIKINFENDNLDGLNYLADKDLSYINKMAMKGTIKAHVDGGVPNIILTMDCLDEDTIGHLIYFFEKSCAMSGILMGVNPFNQPGVEKYKANMFKLLEKPGYTDDK